VILEDALEGGDIPTPCSFSTFLRVAELSKVRITDACVCQLRRKAVLREPRSPGLGDLPHVNNSLNSAMLERANEIRQ
jgi:hypothetical protein